MLELVREGRIAPKAEEVAQRAQVGLRTVFRHFKDMESLYVEMSTAISEQVAPILDEPLNSTDWHDNLDRLLVRRKRVFEAIMPYRVAANVLRYQSHVLLTRYQQIVRDERDKLRAVLPSSIVKDTILMKALEAAVSFDMWSELRNDQRLSFTEAAQVVDRIVYALTRDTIPRT